jgi:carbon-monoxide dehydrogenase medium subunit
MVVAGPAGERRIAATDFFVDFLETDVQPGEILVSIEFPKHTGAGWAYEKFVRRAMDYAIVGVAVQLGSKPGVALINMSSKPHLAVAATQALANNASPSDVVAAVNDGAHPQEDLNATVEYRQHLARVLTQRALQSAAR